MNPPNTKWPTLEGRLSQSPAFRCEALYQLSQCPGVEMSEMAKKELAKCCVFCHMTNKTRGHHIIPRSKGGTEIVPTCETCESYIHKTWSHNQLRDTFNNVETILADEGFQRFLTWRKKQAPDALFKSQRGKCRDTRPYS